MANHEYRAGTQCKTDQCKQYLVDNNGVKVL